MIFLHKKIDSSKFVIELAFNILPKLDMPFYFRVKFQVSSNILEN